MAVMLQLSLNITPRAPGEVSSKSMANLSYAGLDVLPQPKQYSAISLTASFSSHLTATATDSQKAVRIW